MVCVCMCACVQLVDAWRYPQNSDFCEHVTQSALICNHAPSGTERRLEWVHTRGTPRGFPPAASGDRPRLCTRAWASRRM